MKKVCDRKRGSGRAHGGRGRCPAQQIAVRSAVISEPLRAQALGHRHEEGTPPRPRATPVREGADENNRRGDD